ncbi:MAG: Maf family protein [Longimicrobiales bacterium]
MTPSLVLASRSPRRTQLLRTLNLTFDVSPADIDESLRTGESPSAYAERLAREKALTVARQRPDALVVGSDTVVVVDQDLLGKPVDEADAVAMLMRLQGRAHFVETGVAVASSGELVRSAVERVRVVFRAFDEDLAARYVATGEPMDKAGAYGIQGFGSTLVERIEGDFFAVMGLPIVRMLGLLELFGWRYAFDGLQRIETANVDQGEGA